MKRDLGSSLTNIELRSPFEVRKGDIRNRTYLMRSSVFLSVAAKLLLERTSDRDDVSFISAACSYGAEVDSFLATVDEARTGKRVTALGVDINEKNIAFARAGQYYPTKSASTAILEEPEPLEELGFDIERVTMGGVPYAVVDATRVRADREVDFAVHDITKPLEVPAADLVLCNHFLQHVSFEEGSAALKELAAVTAPNGVLGMGVQDLYTGDTHIPGWRRHTQKSVQETLVEQHGMEPITAGDPMKVRYFTPVT